jgi:methylenetetrahydrofolate--tRNA-(uracil-5-)-methyltransferase
LGRAEAPPPPTTAFGALLAHLTGGANADTFQPMNCNFGLFPPLAETSKRIKGQDRKKLYAHRARADLAAWLATQGSEAAA